MALSKEGLVNRALSLMGEPPIVTIGQNDQAGETAEVQYETVRTAILREHTWNSVKKRKTLALHADSPDFGYSNQFVLPTDWLRNVYVNDGREFYSIELSSDNKKVLLTDSSTVELSYVADIDDPNIYDALLVDVFVRRLAAEMCYPITKDKDLTSILWANYKDTLDGAKTINAQDQSGEQTFDANDFIDARVGGNDAHYRPIAG